MTKRDMQASEYAAESYAKSNGKRVNTTMNRDTTPAVGSVHGEGTVGERLVERLSITQTLLDDNETLRAENAQLRKAIRRLAEQDATLSVQGGSVTVTLDATLTDEEREAIDDAAGICEEHAEEYDGTDNSPIAATLRKLLERLNHDAVPEAIAGSDEARTDKAATSHRRDGTGDTLTLTDDEREAIELFATLAWTSIRWSEVEKKAATLRNLLERTK